MDLPAAALDQYSRPLAQRKDDTRTVLDSVADASEYDPVHESEQLLLKAVEEHQAAAINQQVNN